MHFIVVERDAFWEAFLSRLFGHSYRCCSPLIFFFLLPNVFTELFIHTTFVFHSKSLVVQKRERESSFVHKHGHQSEIRCSLTEIEADVGKGLFRNINRKQRCQQLQCSQRIKSFLRRLHGN